MDQNIGLEAKISKEETRTLPRIDSGEVPLIPTKIFLQDPTLTNAIISTDERYNDCCLLNSTVPAQSSDDFLQIIYGTEDSILQQPNSIGHCISAEWVKALPISYPIEFLVLDQHAEKQDFSWDKSNPFGTQQENDISTTWWLKKGFVTNQIYPRCLKH